MMRKIILLLISALGAISCNSDKKNPEYLPVATGKPGDILLIMDSVQWNGPLGEELRNILYAQVPGLPREEPMFNIIRVHPGKKLNVITQIRNLMYVFTLDQHTPGARKIRDGFSQQTLDKIKTDTSFYLSIVKDEYARGQEVMYLYGDTEENLIRHLKQNGKSISDHFNDLERERVQKRIRQVKSTQGISTMLKNEWQCAMKVPAGYKLADKTENFIWLRSMEVDADKNIFLARKPYSSEYQLLPDSLIAWRDSVAQRYLFGDPADPISYVVTEQNVSFRPVQARQVNINGHFAMELRGLWRTNNKTMGGPFLSYTLVDQSNGMLYYIEGFVFSPGREQREIMREMEAILWTFKTSEEAPVK